MLPSNQPSGTVIVPECSKEKPPLCAKCNHPYVSYAEARADSYPEPVDTDIIPLCDALNAAGFPTNASCWGHGTNSPHATFFCSIEQAEALQIALREASEKDVTADGLGIWQACLRMYLYPWGREWEIEIFAHDLYYNSPAELHREKHLHALKQAVAVIRAFRPEPLSAPAKDKP